MQFVHYFKSRQGEMINLLKKIVSLESPTSDKEAVDKCSAFVVSELKKTGADIKRFSQKKTGDFFLAEFPARTPANRNNKQVLVLTHTDTVWPVGRIKKMPFYVSGSKVYGPGILDMKAGLVMVILALRTLFDLSITPKKNISVFINSTEETGSENSEKYIERYAKQSEHVFCLEPAIPGGALKVQRKGRMVIRMNVQGRSAHAGHPEKGVSAIEELITQLRFLSRLRTKGTTVNIGTISGGEKVNMVAEEASAVLDMRFWKNSHAESIHQYFDDLSPKLEGARINYSLESRTPPMEKTTASSRLLSQVKKIAEQMNILLEAGKAEGSSDAAIASNVGAPTIDGLGPDGEGMHAENEHILMPSLIERTALLTEILSQL
jgi:glutamate carboxypeptidase